MFKPRFLMSRRERDRLDARNAKLVELRRKLLAATPAEFEETAATTQHDCAIIRRALFTETTELVAILLALVVACIDGVAHHNALAYGIAVLVLPATISLIDRRTTTSDVYFGAIRQLKEIAILRKGERTRFDDMDDA